MSGRKLGKDTPETRERIDAWARAELAGCKGVHWFSDEVEKETHAVAGCEAEPVGEVEFRPFEGDACSYVIYSEDGELTEYGVSQGNTPAGEDNAAGYWTNKLAALRKY